MNFNLQDLMNYIPLGHWGKLLIIGSRVYVLLLRNRGKVVNCPVSRKAQTECPYSKNDDPGPYRCLFNINKWAFKADNKEIDLEASWKNNYQMSVGICQIHVGDDPGWAWGSDQKCHQSQVPLFAQEI